MANLKRSGLLSGLLLGLGILALGCGSRVAYRRAGVHGNPPPPPAAPGEEVRLQGKIELTDGSTLDLGDLSRPSDVPTVLVFSARGRFPAWLVACAHGGAFQDPSAHDPDRRDSRGRARLETGAQSALERGHGCGCLDFRALLRASYRAVQRGLCTGEGDRRQPQRRDVVGRS